MSISLKPSISLMLKRAAALMLNTCVPPEVIDRLRSSISTKIVPLGHMMALAVPSMRNTPLTERTSEPDNSITSAEDAKAITTGPASVCMVSLTTLPLLLTFTPRLPSS